MRPTRGRTNSSTGELSRKRSPGSAGVIGLASWSLREAPATKAAASSAGASKPGASGAEIVTAQTNLIDALLRVLLEWASHVVYPEPNPTTASRLSLVAVGGYGRGDLAPRSDVDILFLHPYKLTGRSEADRRASALHVVGPWLCRGPRHPLNRGLPAPGAGGHDDPNLECLNRATCGAIRRSTTGSASDFSAS